MRFRRAIVPTDGLVEADLDLYAELMQHGDLPDPLLEALRLRPSWHAEAAL